MIRVQRRVISREEALRINPSDDETRLIGPQPCIFSEYSFVIFENYLVKTKDFNIIQVLRGDDIPEYAQSVEGSAIFELPNTYSVLKNQLLHLQRNRPGSDPIIKEIRTITISTGEIAQLVSFFTIYPVFGAVYKNYILDHDSNVSMVQRIGYPPTFTEGKMSINDAKATVHLLLLMMGKTFSTRESAAPQKANFYNNRLKAIQNALRDPNARFLLPIDNLEKVNQFWSMLPKLKEGIFSILFTLKDRPEISTALNLLSNASMITIRNMERFLSATKLSRAHLIPQIWKEGLVFNRKINDYKESLGELWPYYRVINQDDSGLASAQFPNLSRAAVLYAKKFINTDPTFANLVVPNHEGQVAELDMAAQTELSSEHYNMSRSLPASVTENERAFAESMGIVLDAWVPHQFMGARHEAQDDRVANVIRAEIARLGMRGQN